jgi:hypothetical protein
MKPIKADAILAEHFGEAADEFYGVSIHEIRRAAGKSGVQKKVTPSRALVARRGKALYEKLVLGKSPSYETEEEMSGLVEYVDKMIAKYSGRPRVKALRSLIARCMETASAAKLSPDDKTIITRAFSALPLLDVPLPAFHKAVMRMMNGPRPGR